jgi:hypothetical protein
MVGNFRLRDYFVPFEDGKLIPDKLTKQHINCGVCNIGLLHRIHLLNHTERFHATVSRHAVNISTR